MKSNKALNKLIRDTGGGCSVCGLTPVVNVDGTYWLCGGCVSEKLGDAKDAARYRWLRERPSFIGWDWWEPPVPRDILITPEFMDDAIDEKMELREEENRLLARTEEL